MVKKSTFFEKLNFSLSASIFPFKNNGIKFFDPVRDSPFYQLLDDASHDKFNDLLLYEKTLWNLLLPISSIFSMYI